MCLNLLSHCSLFHCYVLIFVYNFEAYFWGIFLSQYLLLYASLLANTCITYLFNCIYINYCLKLWKFWNSLPVILTTNFWVTIQFLAATSLKGRYSVKEMSNYKYTCANTIPYLCTWSTEWRYSKPQATSNAICTRSLGPILWKFEVCVYFW